ncbi:Putative phosphatidate phosphatase [Eumeta japonica]|uniref:Phosphatidate phosphatase n=1 Tax=Eumeta variegata TaxID=151549 RepID=A0A4C1UML4_EUMVA|nr:Putative phosphatidate phosphatase [Eumeta japonica]
MSASADPDVAQRAAALTGRLSPAGVQAGRGLRPAGEQVALHRELHLPRRRSEAAQGDAPVVPQRALEFLRVHHMYLQRRVAWRGSKLTVHALQFLLVMLAWYTAMSRISDYKHHWSDVLAGFGIGILYAVIIVIYIHIKPGETATLAHDQPRGGAAHDQRQRPLRERRVAGLTTRRFGSCSRIGSRATPRDHRMTGARALRRDPPTRSAVDCVLKERPSNETTLQINNDDPSRVRRTADRDRRPSHSTPRTKGEVTPKTNLNISCSTKV